MELYGLKSIFCLLPTIVLLNPCITADDEVFFDTPAQTYQEFVVGAPAQAKQQSSFQSAGTGAAVGDATGDTGTIASNQVLNVNTNDQGTSVQSASRGSGEGTNIHVSRSSQAKSGGQASKQGLISTVAVRPVPPVDNQPVVSPDQDDRSAFTVSSIPSPTRRIRTMTLPPSLSVEQENQLQSNGGTAAVGDGTVDQGSVTSNQDSSLNTNDQGAVAQSSSVGQGNGINVKVNGAAQAESNGQSADQSGFSRPIVNGQLVPDGMRVGSISQNQGQTTGKGGSTGEAVVAEGEGSSVQDANVETNAAGTIVRSSSVGRASGNKIRLSGAASASSSGNNSGQTFVNNNKNNRAFDDNGSFQPWQNRNGFFGNRLDLMPVRNSRMLPPNMSPMRFGFFPFYF
ncbi:hypothetical protein RvY_07113 [Ramazzottius varieornatus]|uniref:Uncharacterized protein n=1 Tax=Ramazzottius varieornatus TaxID=947166 RepID=A0A1D1V0Y1_RAMVA|nr:hypothetical protein RvY_07113 [Ramazzottius varieornatus]